MGICRDCMVLRDISRVSFERKNRGPWSDNSLEDEGG